MTTEESNLSLSRGGACFGSADIFDSLYVKRCMFLSYYNTPSVIDIAHEVNPVGFGGSVVRVTNSHLFVATETDTSIGDYRGILA
jgi:hypothetical protein